MNLKSLVQACALLFGSFAASGAWGASCTLSPSSSTVNFATYNSTTGTLSAALSLNFSCTRDSTFGNQSVDFTAVAGQGGNYVSPNRRMKETVSNTFMNYALLKSTTLTNHWGNVAGTVPPSSSAFTSNFSNGNFTSGGSNTIARTLTYYVNLPLGQSPVGSVTYTDTVTITGSCTTSNSAACTGNTVSITVNLVASQTCSLSQAPASMALIYTSFQTVQASAVSNFGVTCSNALPYWLSLDSAAASQAVATTTVNGTQANINYSLTVPSASQTGTGAQQNFVVTGAIAANQSGTCNTATCTPPASSHTLYVNY
jgi:spore coat protein U-like protein